MYLLYVDESGSHETVWNQAFVLAGVAVHETDVLALGAALDGLVQATVPFAADPSAYELHAAEIRRPTDDSPWRNVDGQVRRHIREQTLRAIADFRGADGRGTQLFAQVLPPGDRRTRSREAYGRLLNRFDDWLAARDERGMLVSDVCDHSEREIQDAALDWREAAGPWGKLEHVIEVPLFADSKASRLLQAADLVAWATWNRFGNQKTQRHWWDIIEARVELVLDRA